MKPYDNSASKGAQIETMFNTIAPRYDLLNRVLSLGIDRGWRRAVVRRVCGAEHILDVATGTADMALALAKALPKATIVGVDISQGMLRVAQQKVDSKALSDRISFSVASAQTLSYADGEFDAVTVAFGVRNFENLSQGISQMRRVVRKGGAVYILEFSTPKNKIFGLLFNFYFHKVLPLLGGLVSGDAKAYDYLPRSVDEFPSVESFVEIMRRAGFASVDVVPLTFGVANIYIGRL